MMEEDQDLRFVCKLCNKRYPCGKSLGGHMRSHVIANSSHFDENFEANIAGQQHIMSESKVAELGNGQSSYGLRENPRKTWRAVDSTFPLVQDRVCKQCGKGFQSMKALCGHMACHSEKDRGLKEDDHSWTSENEKMVLDSYSDTEEGDDSRLRTGSSKSKKCKKVDVKSPTFSSANNGSSFVSEIDGKDQEEVAMCLMLLSKDSGNKVGVNSVVESSDNISVVLETKSSSIDMRFGKNEGINGVYIGEETPQVKNIGDRKLKDTSLNIEIAKMENSDSGYFLDECAKAESDASVGRGVEEYGAEFGRSENRKKNFRPELRNEFSKENEYNNSAIASKFARIESRKRKRSYEDPESWNKTISSMKNGHIEGEACSNSQKTKYECFNCKKTFKSYQALGGHRPCHKRSNAYYESRYENGENILDDFTDVQTTGNRKPSAKSSSQLKIKPKKNKGHVCPFCDRVFKNGQALGGHKRSHFIVSNYETQNQSRRKKTELHNLLDLNLPAPEEDEDDGRGRFF